MIIFFSENGYFIFKTKPTGTKSRQVLPRIILYFLTSISSHHINFFILLFLTSFPFHFCYDHFENLPLMTSPTCLYKIFFQSKNQNFSPSDISFLCTFLYAFHAIHDPTRHLLLSPKKT